MPGDRFLLIAGLAIAGAIIAGMFVESGVVTAVAAAAALLGALLFPPLGLIVLAIMGALRAPGVVPAPGFIVILVVMILLGCVYRLPTSRTRLRSSVPLKLLLAFVLYAFVQQVPELAAGYAGAQGHDIGYLFLQLLTGVGIIIAAGLVLRGRSPYPFLAALLVSATIAAVLGILAANAAGGGLANLLSPVAEGVRASGPFGNPNNYGQLLAYAIVLAAGLFVIAYSFRLRAGLLAIAGICAYAMSLSLSRGAIATLLAGLVVLAFARSRALGFAAASIALALVLVGYPLFLESRLTTDEGSASSAAVAELAASDEGRLSAILAGPELFAMSPVFGIGFGQYKYMSALVTEQGAGLVAHNWYGTVLAEQGILGIVLWVAMLVGVAGWLRTRPPRPRLIGLAMLGAVIVGCMFLEPPTSFQTSTVVMIVLTGALVAEWGATVTTGTEEETTPGLAGHSAGGRRGQMEAAGRRMGA
jgi:O-antigen ligase